MDEERISKTIENYEKVAEEYHKSHEDIEEIKDTLDLFISYLNGNKVLDIGCGPGRDAKYLSEKGFDVTGIDLTENFIKIASKNAPKSNFIKMDMRKLNFQENIFDGIWVCASLLHIPKSQVKETILEFRKVLKEGGVIFLSVKKGQGEKFVRGRYNNEERFFQFYDEKEFIELVKSCNFKIMKTMIETKKDIWINVFAQK